MQRRAMRVRSRVGRAWSRDGWPSGGNTVGVRLLSDLRNEKGNRSEVRATILGAGCTSLVSGNKSTLSRCYTPKHRFLSICLF